MPFKTNRFEFQGDRFSECHYQGPFLIPDGGLLCRTMRNIHVYQMRIDFSCVERPCFDSPNQISISFTKKITDS